MNRRTFLQSLIAVPLVAVGMPRVTAPTRHLWFPCLACGRDEYEGRGPFTVRGYCATCAPDLHQPYQIDWATGESWTELAVVRLKPGEPFEITGRFLPNG